MSKKALIYQDDDLIANAEWVDQGYVVASLFQDLENYEQLKAIFSTLVKNHLRKIYTVSHDVDLSHYHHIVKTDHMHYQFIKEMGNFFSADLLGEIKPKLERRVSELCCTDVCAKHPDFNDEVFNMRIVRPKSADHNPLHRDVWLDRLRNGVNIYVPIAGSNALSSLTVIPGSHFWSDDDIEKTESGAEVDGRKYTVPAVTQINREYETIRPNPDNNEVLVFTPYMLHGGASNLNDDITRVSLEMRFWRR